MLPFTPILFPVLAQASSAGNATPAGSLQNETKYIFCFAFVFLPLL